MSFLQNPSLSLSPPLHSQRHQLQYNPYVSAYSTVTTAPTATTLLTSIPIPSHPPNTFFPPFFMDSGPTVPNPATTTNNPVAASPTTSNASVLSATVVNPQPQPQPSSKKKQGRGPGKKDIKDKPAVSVRWDDGDLTDRLIAAVEKNDRWLGVFAQSSNDPNAARTAAPVAKRDLQREIARYLFGKDPRYDLDDRKVLESLAVSVKNKLFKLTTLYTECKQELGQLCTLKDERELIPGSDAAATWARVKEKFPQYTRIRELMSRVGSPGSTPRASGPDASVSPPHVRHSPISPVLRQRDTNVAPLSNGQVPNHSSLKGTIDFPREASYSDPTSIPSAQYATAPAAMSVSTIPSPTYTISNSTMPLSAGYPSGRSSGQRRMTSSSTAPPNSSRPSTAVSQAASAPRQHSPQHFTHTAASSSATQRPTPYTRPSLPAGTMNEMQAHLQAALDIIPEYNDPRDPSPPLSATIQHIVSVLTERKERERSRAHELEVLRMKREEADKSRWHQREMMRLKIQLLRAERAASANPAASTPTGTSQLGGVEEDLAIAAGLGDDMSMEGDGEGELDEDIMYDPEPGRPLSHHGASSTR